MGGKKSKPSNAGDTKPVVVPQKNELTEKDYNFLTARTEMSRPEIKQFFDDFMAGNPDGKLDRREFCRLYDKLRPEPPELIDEISVFVFEAFDQDDNGKICFNEFLVAYSLTTEGEPKEKLEYAFDLYDVDENGSLTSEEVRSVIVGMLDLLGADKKTDSRALAAECFEQLDANRDDRVCKQEFIEGLLANYSLRALMSPFN
ncbi:neuronal calcium sensor 2-like [Brachionus plicatilis]|uniref:Neuronal calcium sensor 2-like n=1 Tax=Brachionus plicatilis TaxID=10195 RepID=A0A3M7PZ99_BRAPC|nr:neuronal calcium sensor 2-like [Brachionus plicatilis]